MGNGASECGSGSIWAPRKKGTVHRFSMHVDEPEGIVRADLFDDEEEEIEDRAHRRAVQRLTRRGLGLPDHDDHDDHVAVDATLEVLALESHLQDPTLNV